MELRDTTVLLLGGSGLVGMAIARRLLEHGPRRLVIAGLAQEEAEAGVRELAAESRGVEIQAAWGNIFLPADLAGRGREELLRDPASRRRLVEDVFLPASETSVEHNLLYGWLVRYMPDIVVDTVNTATAFAYQDVFASALRLLEAAERGTLDVEAVERHLLTLPSPQLIRHMETMFAGMRRAGTKAYVKIGTSGTGGMGLNIPYTHSEERPSRTLMTKSAVAGAQSLFLFLHGRTPNEPATIEIKPTAAIAWREIGYGPIRRGGRALEVVDCETPQPVERAFGPDAGGWTRTGEPLRNAYINMGENGLFAREEFETVSALGQMELVTPEEIAEAVVTELRGQATGKDIVAALDAASFGPTYRAGYLRAHAIEELDALERQHGVRSVAFEMLGPPRLSKLLYEAHILGRLVPSVAALAAADPDATAADAESLLRVREPHLRREILSVGLPILLADGERVLRGEVVVVPPAGRGAAMAARGWVDLRPANIRQWVDRARAVVAQGPRAGSGSRATWGAIRPDAPIKPAQMAVWVFEQEEGGYRTKR